jgi:hypothetical protein
MTGGIATEGTPSTAAMTARPTSTTAARGLSASSMGPQLRLASAKETRPSWMTRVSMAAP